MSLAAFNGFFERVLELSRRAGEGLAREFTAGDAASGPKSARGVRDLCEWVELPLEAVDGAGGGAWRGLIETLRERIDGQGPNRGPRSGWRAPNFSDVLLDGPTDTNSHRADALRDLLNVDFAEDGVEFRARSIARPGAQKLFGFFGTGVFIPPEHTERVAEVSFSWSDPSGEAFTPEDALTPRLGAAPAGWYGGQQGLAIGFDANRVPVVLPLPDPRDAQTPLQQAAEARKALADALLFLGRENRDDPPSVRLHALDPEGPYTTAVESLSEEWWLRDGDWLRLDLTLRRKKDGAIFSRPLWFRFARRLGDARFSSDIGTAPEPGVARLVIRGLLAPTPGKPIDEEEDWLKRLSKSLGAGTQISPPVRIALEFDEKNRFRLYETCALARAYIADLGGDERVYLHKPGKWGEEGTAQGRERLRFREVPLLRDRIPKESLEARAGGPGGKAKKLPFLRSWRRYAPGDGKALGALDILADKPFMLAGAPAAPSGEAEPQRRLGLDWLNRGARIEDRSGGLRGLAEHWERLCDVTVVAKDQALEIRLVRKDKDRTKSGSTDYYEIRKGEEGPLGPLWIEYAGVAASAEAQAASRRDAERPAPRAQAEPDAEPPKPKSDAPAPAPAPEKPAAARAEVGVAPPQASQESLAEPPPAAPRRPAWDDDELRDDY